MPLFPVLWSGTAPMSVEKFDEYWRTSMASLDFRADITFVESVTVRLLVLVGAARGGGNKKI